MIANRKTVAGFAILLVLLIAAPIATSYMLLKGQKESTSSNKNVLMVQANIDPYEKFELSTATNEIQKLVSLSESNIDSST